MGSAHRANAFAFCCRRAVAAPFMCTRLRQIAEHLKGPNDSGGETMPANDTCSDLNHALAAVLAGQKSDQGGGRVLKSLDNLFLDF